MAEVLEERSSAKENVAGSAVEARPVDERVNIEDEACELQEKQDECDKKNDCTASRTQLDEVLIEALRVPRDRIFVLLQEKDMEDRIRSGQEQVWELPLMNSYQRLLVHRIADHFHLSHSIDAVTKAVTLTRQVDTEIPESSLSTLAMADMERLSEPAYAVSRDSSAAGFKIMRREGRSDSPRNGLSDGKNLGKDRRNMTIEEREAAYKEARQRIFGSEEACVETVNDAVVCPTGEVEVKALANLSLEVENGNSGDSRKNTPGQLSPAPSSTSSSSSAAFLRAGAPSFDPSQRGTPVEAPHWQSPAYGYPVIDANGNHYFPYPGGFVWPPYLQHDSNGRQIVPQGATPVMSPSFYPLSTPGSSGSNQDVYSSIGHSPSVSSRSTSISADTEGDGGQTSVVRSNMVDQSHNTMTSANRGRPHTISPSSSFQQGRNGSSFHPSGSSNGSSTNSGAVNLMPPHVYQGQVPVPASWSQYPNSPMTYTNRQYQLTPMYNGEDPSGRSQPSQRMGYAAALANSRGNGTIASSSSSVHSSESASGYLSPVASNSSRMDEFNQSSQIRSRNGPSDRSLFDPHKPSNISNSSNGGQYSAPRADHSINKSTSAASISDGRPNTDSTRSSSTNNSLSSLPSDVARRLSSTSTSPTESIRRVTPPSHPSLPARPDWVISQRNKPAIDKPTDDSTNQQAAS
jgi:hypothetical protein